VQQVTSHRVFAAEQGRLRSHAQRVDELGRRAETALGRGLERARDRFRRGRERLEAFRWDRQAALRRDRVSGQLDRLGRAFGAVVERRRARLARLAAQLDGLSPLAVLARGYALVWDAEKAHLVRSPADVAVGDELRVRLPEGGLRARVTAKETE
jgi:exodeoxyribonuclease VII large subunit